MKQSLNRTLAIFVALIAMQIVLSAQSKTGSTKTPIIQKSAASRKIAPIAPLTSAARLTNFKALLIKSRPAIGIKALQIDDVLTLSVQQPFPNNGTNGYLSLVNATASSPSLNYAYFHPPGPKPMGVYMLLAFPSDGDYVVDISCTIDDVGPQSPKNLVLDDAKIASASFSGSTSYTFNQKIQVTDDSHHVLILVKGRTANTNGAFLVTLEQGSWEFDSATISHIKF